MQNWPFLKRQWESRDSLKGGYSISDRWGEFFLHKKFMKEQKKNQQNQQKHYAQAHFYYTRSAHFFLPPPLNILWSHLLFQMYN